MKALTLEELLAFPRDQKVWVIVDKSDLDHQVLIPMNLDYDMGVFAFLEQADAEQMVRIMKGQEKLGITQELLRDLGDGSMKHETPLVVLDSPNAMDFLTRYPDMLDKYYGY